MARRKEHKNDAMAGEMNKLNKDTLATELAVESLREETIVSTPRGSLPNHLTASSSGRNACFLSCLFPSDDSYSFYSEPSALWLNPVLPSKAALLKMQIVCEGCAALWISDHSG